MAKQEIIVHKDGTHAPAEAGDTIDHSLIPISSESGNALSVKDDGLFASAGAGGSSPVSLVREGISIDNVQGKDFSAYGAAYTYKFTDASGQEKQFVEAVGKPTFFTLNVEGDSDNSLQPLYLTPWLYSTEAGGEASLGNYINLPSAKLETPELAGTTLKIKLKHMVAGEDVSGSTQTVSVDLAGLAGGGAASFEGATYIASNKLKYANSGPNQFKYQDYGDWYEHVFKKASGEEVKIKLPHAFPSKLEYTVNGNRGRGIDSNILTRWTRNDAQGENLHDYIHLATAFLQTPTIQGGKLVLGLEYREGGYSSQKIQDSDQKVEFDLAGIYTTVPDPSDPTNAANKKYVDDRVEAALAGGGGAPSPQTTPLVLQGRAQYARCKLAPFDGGGNSAAKTKDVVNTNTPGQNITFSNELSFQTTKAGWYRIKVLYTAGTSSGIFLNNGVAKFPETTAPVLAEDAFPPVGSLEFMVKVEANKKYRTNLADKTARDVNVTNVHFIVEYVGE